MIYKYLKKQPKVSWVKKQTKIWQIMPFAFLVLGGFFLLSVFWPILSYEFKSRGFNANKLISPVEVLGDSATVIDYSQPSSWFPTAPSLSNKDSKITHYSLSIPKLKIDRAVVKVGGQDLMDSLVHYPGTSLPGQYGNAVIFGHSVLPQFFNPKNYKTIFSTLPTLKKGDEIFIDFDGILYRYQVINMEEVSPDNVRVLEQRYDSEYLSLITCVPPGTYLRRLVIMTKLMKF